MHKKGQFYIITVLIASFAIYTLVHGANTLYEPIFFSDFDTLSNNYVHEAPIVINKAIHDRGNFDVAEDLNAFTKEYLNYAQQKNPTIGLFYVYYSPDPTTTEDKITVNNYMSETLYLPGEDVFGAKDDSIQHVAIDVGGKNFFFTVPVEISNFGEDFYAADLPSGYQSLDIQLGSVVHTINLPDNVAPSYTVVVQSTNGQRVEVLTREGGSYIP